MPKSNGKEIKESSTGAIDRALNNIKAGAVNFKNTLSTFGETVGDFFQNLYEKLIEPLIPAQVKDWVKKNLFSTEESKENTKNINEVYNKLKGNEKPDFFPFYLAMQGYNNQKGKIRNSKYLTVIDYSKPVSQNRLYVINMDTLTIENCVPTGHGKRSGNTKKTDSFSNTPNSNQTSIGFFRTPNKPTPNSKNTWNGLFLTGMEFSNNQARSRGIAVHGVQDFFYSQNKNGHKAGESTSEGCITIRHRDKPEEIMNKIQGDSLIYSYYPDKTYLDNSTMIKLKQK